MLMGQDELEAFKGESVPDMRYYFTSDHVLAGAVGPHANFCVILCNNRHEWRAPLRVWVDGAYY